jgi:hypothetical protein
LFERCSLLKKWRLQSVALSLPFLARAMSFLARMPAEIPSQPVTVSFAEAVRMWLKVGLLSFGRTAGQIATMHRLLVEERRWIDEKRFLHALNFCMLLPGPAAAACVVFGLAAVRHQRRYTKS